MLAIKAVFWRFASRRIAPNNLISKILSTEDGINEHAQIAIGGVVAVEEDASRFFEQFVAKQQAGGHKQQVGFHAVGMLVADDLAEAEQVFVFVCDESQFPFGELADFPVVFVVLDSVTVRVGKETELLGFHFVVFAHLLFIEWRVGNDGVGNFGVEAEHHFPVVTAVKG